VQTDAPRVQINRLYISFNKLHVAKNAPYRVDDIARKKISRRYFVQHRRKQNKILAAD